MVQRRLQFRSTYMKSDWILWDPLAIDLNSTPSRSISWGKHHSTMFPVGKGRCNIIQRKWVSTGLSTHGFSINRLLTQPDTDQRDAQSSAPPSPAGVTPEDPEMDTEGTSHLRPQTLFSSLRRMLPLILSFCSTTSKSAFCGLTSLHVFLTLRPHFLISCSLLNPLRPWFYL